MHHYTPNLSSDASSHRLLTEAFQYRSAERSDTHTWWYVASVSSKLGGHLETTSAPPSQYKYTPPQHDNVLPPTPGKGTQWAILILSTQGHSILALRSC